MFRDAPVAAASAPFNPALYRRAARCGSSLDIPVRLAIELVVGRVFGVAETSLNIATRGRAEAAQARQVAMYLAHVACGLSLTEAGRLFSRDRTTVAHACLVVEDKREDPVFDRTLDLLELAVPVIAARPGRYLSNP